MFPSQGFTEIVFCAVTSNEQVKVRVTQGLRRDTERGASMKAGELGKVSVSGPEKAPSGVQDFPKSILSPSVCICVFKAHGSIYPQSGAPWLCWTLGQAHHRAAIQA